MTMEMDTDFKSGFTLFHATGGDLSCGSVTQDIFLTIWTVVLIANAAYIFTRIGRALQKVNNGQLHEANILVYPIYLRYLLFAFVLLVLRAVMIRFIPGNTWYFVLIYLGVLNSLSAGIREGMFVFLIQDNAGSRAVKRAEFVFVIWTLYTASLGIFSYLDYNYFHIAGDFQFLGTSYCYYVSFDASVVLFHIGCLLYMFDFPRFRRRSKRISNLHIGYSLWHIGVFALYLGGDFIGRYSGNGCLTLLTQMAYYVTWPLLSYYLLRKDSYYWRHLGAPKKRAFVTPSGKPMAINDDDDEVEDWESVPEQRNLLESYTKERLQTRSNSKLIDFSRLVVGSLLGQGGNAKVYKGKFDGKVVAIKQIRCQTLSKEEIEVYLEEVEIADQLKHPNIIETYGVSVILPYIAVVMEFAHRGTLFTLLPQVKELNYTRKLEMCIDFASALHHLHSQNPPIVHFDLKSLNLLVDKNWRVKLADFGESRRVNTGEDFKTKKMIKGTVHWLAPEAFHSFHYSEKTDIYAAGVVLSEILTGQPPYTGMHPSRIPQLVMEGKRPPLPRDCPPDLKKLIEKCWHQEPAQRPTAGYMLEQLELLLEAEKRRTE